MLIDAGAPGQADVIIRALASIGVQPIYIKKIVVTHHHLGHVGGLAVLKRRSGAPVHAHRSDVPYISGQLKRRAPRNPVERAFHSAVVWTGAADVPPVHVERKIDQDSLVNGWQVIYTPGHTPGHICLLRDGMLIGGDLLQARAGGFREMPHTSIADLASARASIARVAALDFDAILPAHSPPYVFDARARVAELAEKLGSSPHDGFESR